MAAGIGTATIGAGKKLYDMTDKAAAAEDEINKASQRIGLSRKGYQEWYYVLSQNGASISTFGMKKLNNTVDDAIQGSPSAAERFQSPKYRELKHSGYSTDSVLSVCPG